MATAFKQEFLAPAAAPARPVLRLVEPARPLPPSWMCAPAFRMDEALANPALIAPAYLND